MTTIESSSQVIAPDRRRRSLSVRTSWPRWPSWLATAAGPWRPTVTTCAALFQWAADHSLPGARRPPAPTWSCTGRRWKNAGLAASTIDRRLSTACGFYRFAHIDGRIASNPAQYVRRPTVPPVASGGASTAASWPGSSSPPSASTTPTPPWPCCWA